MATVHTFKSLIRISPIKKIKQFLKAPSFCFSEYPSLILSFDWELNSKLSLESKKGLGKVNFSIKKFSVNPQQY